MPWQYFYAILVIAAISAVADIQCGDDEFPCTDGSRCILADQFCDSRRDCQDGSDEQLRNVRIKYNGNETFCKGIDGYICVIKTDIAHRVEQTCKSDLQCEKDEFPCTDGSRCIPGDRFCDILDDCPDGSDRRLRNASIKYDANDTFCRRESLHGGMNGLRWSRPHIDICVAQANIVQRIGLGNCDDAIRCENDEFPCLDGSQCIPRDGFCDGRHDCRDGSDERLRKANIIYDSNETFCKNNDSNPTLQIYGSICVIKADVAQLLNPTNCDDDIQCRDDEFSCADGSRCIPVNQVCDSRHDCQDGSDEQLRNIKIKNDANETFCRGRNGNICVVKTGVATPMAPNCKRDYECRSDEFPCADGSQCVSDRTFCDGTINCRDGSDELAKESDNVLLKSNMSSCKSIYSGKTCKISVELDLKKYDYCREYSLGNSNFRCFSSPSSIILKANLCNGEFDCPDLSDECLCSSKTRMEECEKLLPGDVLANSSELVGSRVADRRRYKCQQEEGKFATKCDGIPECTVDYYEEECSCTTPAKFCVIFTTGCGRAALARDGGYFVFPITEGLASIFRPSDICNGVSDCPNSSDELGCTERFYCSENPLPNIQLKQICDGNTDCPDGIDEDVETYFCCKDAGSLNYIPRSMVCDGVQDCYAGSDECQHCIVSAFSDDSSLISSNILVGFVWIISISAMGGCQAVFASTARDLIRPKKRGDGITTNNHTKVIKILILSLSISDLLVAIYTMAICVKAVQFAQGYCRVDRSWRSSSTCSALGAILVIGSEQSVFTMVLIAIQRLYAILRPFSSPNIRLTTAAVLLSWAISIALGLIPMLAQLEDYFVSSIMFTDNEIFKEIYNTETGHMIAWLGLMHQNSSTGNYFGMTEWSKIRNLTAEVNPDIKVNYEFGYYSSHTVCLPTFFPDREKDKAWGYTLLILLINFIAFLFMMISYIILYRHATKSKVSGQSSAHQRKRDEQNAKMQRKLTRIVLSDFLCWMPICIMGFLQIMEVKIPDDAYLPAGLLIIPINSALNPILYSDLPEIVMTKLQKLKQQFNGRPDDPATESIEMT